MENMPTDVRVWMIEQFDMNVAAKLFQWRGERWRFGLRVLPSCGTWSWRPRRDRLDSRSMLKYFLLCCAFGWVMEKPWRDLSQLANQNKRKDCMEPIRNQRGNKQTIKSAGKRKWSICDWLKFCIWLGASHCYLVGLSTLKKLLCEAFPKSKVGFST